MIVDDTPSNLGVLFECLHNAGFKVLAAQDGVNALGQAERAKPDLILLDIRMPGLNGYETCGRLKSAETTKDIPVIFMTALSDTQDKVKAFAVGGVDYITKPFQHEEVLARVRTHLNIQRLQRQLLEQNARLQQTIEAHQQAQATVRYLRDEIKTDHNFEEIIGQSDALRRVLHQVDQVANTDSTVLVHGETGTGKELIARALHHRSSRRDQPLIKLNCAALPCELIESELFGHEKGAFTGATQKRKGRFELAHQGTLFLDEVSELSLEAQAKLLRILQEQEFERVGGVETLHINVRVIAATNRDLGIAIQQGVFRSDLYYRLAVFPVAVPPLREREGDIPLLAEHFLDKLARKLGKSFTGFTPASFDKLAQHTWPGNIRELHNVLERAAILSPGPSLEIDQTLDNPLNLGDQHTSPSTTNTSTLEEVERTHIEQILVDTHWVIEGHRGAAALLGLNPSTLRHRIRKLGIRKPIPS
jgi:DNA-binding NtrC family response regulator